MSDENKNEKLPSPSEAPLPTPETKKQPTPEEIKALTTLEETIEFFSRKDIEVIQYGEDRRSNLLTCLNIINDIFTKEIYKNDSVKRLEELNTLIGIFPEELGIKDQIKKIVDARLVVQAPVEEAEKSPDVEVKKRQPTPEQIQRLNTLDDAITFFGQKGLGLMVSTIDEWEFVKPKLQGIKDIFDRDLYKDDPVEKEAQLESRIVTLPSEFGIQDRIRQIVKEQVDLEKEGALPPPLLKPTFHTQPPALPPRLPTEPPPLPQRFETLSEAGKEIETRLSALGLTREELRTIDGFDETFEQSEGQMLFLLKNLEQVKFKKVRTGAKKAHEEWVANSDLVGKIWLGISAVRNHHIKKHQEKLVEQSVGGEHFDKFKDEIAAIVHIANVGPKIQVIEENGENKLIAQHFNIAGKERECESFNMVATLFAEIPPQYQWKKFKPAEVKKFQEVKARYEAAQGEMAFLMQEEFGKQNVPEDKLVASSLLAMNDVDLDVKMHQELINHPEVEIELQNLREKKGWDKMVDNAKIFAENVNSDSGRQFLIRQAGRPTLAFLGSAIGGAIGGAILPLSMVAMSIGFGAKRGGKRAEEQLDREAELLRMGEEENPGMKKYSKKLEPLLAQKKFINEHIAALNGLSDADRKVAGKRLEAQLQNVNNEIAEIKAKNTDLNVIKFEEPTTGKGPLYKILNLQQEINKFGRDESEEKTKLQQKLVLRLKYTKEKLDAGKIVFGEGAVGAKNHFRLVQAMSGAIADLIMNPPKERGPVEFIIPMDRKFDAGKKVERGTRQSRLQTVLARHNLLIAQNQDAFIGKQKLIGAVTGGILSGVGVVVGHAIASHFAHDVAEQTSAIAKTGSHTDALAFRDATENATKEALANKAAEKIIDPGIKLPPSAPAVPAKEVFKFTIKTERQSRESALIEYFKSKGLSKHDAGIEAHKSMKEMFGPKGEGALKAVHARDQIVIKEVNGKPEFQPIISKALVHDIHPPKEVVETVEIKDHQVDQFTHRKINVDSAERAVTRSLRLHADEYGFKGDVADKTALNDWVHEMTKQVLDQNAEIATQVTHDGNVLELHRTVTGGWLAEIKKTVAETHQDVSTAAPASAPEIAAPIADAGESALGKTSAVVTELLSNYEVKAPISLPEVLEHILEKDPRFLDLPDDDARDRALYDFFVNHYVINSVTSSEFYTDIGFTNPFDIEIGKTLELDNHFGNGEDVVTHVIKNAIATGAQESLNKGLGIRLHLNELAQALKGLKPNEITEKVIAEKLEELRDSE